MGSTRLPGKTLMKVKGKTMLGYLVERVNRSKSLDEVIVATSTNKENDAINDECIKLGIGCFRLKNEDDVLNRYLQATRWVNADISVRITADSILMDSQVIDYITGEYLAGKYDCATNYSTKSFPKGFSISVFSKESLSIINDLELSASEREHVILAYLNHRDRFHVLDVKAPSKWQAYPLSLALDSIEDFKLISKIIQELSKIKRYYSLDDILSFIKSKTYHTQPITKNQVY